MSNEQTPTPMTAEEFFKGHYAEDYGKFHFPRLEKSSWLPALLSVASNYANYRLAFEREQKQPADPYYTDPATWPEWAKWRAVGEDGYVYFSSQPMELNLSFGSWSTSIYAASRMVPRAVTHNPNWRNSLRSREEVSRGK